MSHVKMVTNAKEAEEYKIGEDTQKEFERFTELMHKQGDGDGDYLEKVQGALPNIVDYAAEVSGIDKVTVNGKVYLAADKVLETIDKVANKKIGAVLKFREFWTAAKTIMVLRRDIEALKGGGVDELERPVR